MYTCLRQQESESLTKSSSHRNV